MYVRARVCVHVCVRVRVCVCVWAAVGSCRPDWQESDPQLMLDSAVYVDTKETAVKESGDIIKSAVHVLIFVQNIFN